MILVFSGYNQRAIIAFLRTCKNNKLDFCIVASSFKDTIFLTDFADNIIYTRENDDLTLKLFSNIHAIICELQNNNEEIWVAPSSEMINRFLLLNHKDLLAQGYIIPLTDYDTYELISDKYSFEKLCNSYGILSPTEFIFSNVFSEPIVAKPKKYFSSGEKVFNPIFINSKEEMIEFSKNHNMYDFSYQKFLNGGNSFYLLFYFYKNGDYEVFSQENYMQQSDGKSILAAATSDIHNNKNILDPFVNLFTDLKFHGLVMVEIRFLNDKFYMIEANPRFWGPSQLFCDAKNNLFDCYLYDYSFLDNKPSFKQKERAYYYWSGGVLDELSKDKEVSYFGNGKYLIEENLYDFLKYDVYNRDDSFEIYFRENLLSLYKIASKHSGYQILPEKLNNIIKNDDLIINSHYEKERINFILRYLAFKNMSVLDIGGNIGYFSFTALDQNAKYVEYYDGNNVFSEFVELASKYMLYDSKINVNNEYFMFNKDKIKTDICFCMNVIHHLGDDFGNVSDIEKAKDDMASFIVNLSNYSDYLIFQMGFNWKGNRNQSLFENGTKKEMIDFVVKYCQEKWDILAIGIAQKVNNRIVYEELNEINIQRTDELGEFLNRPLFILKNKKIIRD